MPKGYGIANVNPQGAKCVLCGGAQTVAEDAVSIVERYGS